MTAAATLRRSVVDAAATAAIALILGIPLIGLETVVQRQGLGLVTRWGLLASVVATVFAIRLSFLLFPDKRRYFLLAGGISLAALVVIWRDAWLAAAAIGLASAVAALFLDRLTAAAAPALRRDDLQRAATIAALAFALSVPFWADTYVINVAILIMTYVMLGWGLNIVVGLAGLLDLGYVAFYAVGAYSFALLAANFGLGFWECLPIAGLMAATFGVLLGFPVLRLRGDYLAIVTLGFGEIIHIVLKNWTALTNGPNGVPGVPRPTLFGLSFAAPAPGRATFAEFFGVAHSPMHRLVFLYLIIFGLALLTNLVTMRLRKLPIGRAWEALREDEIACRSLGLNPTTVKLSAFAIGAMFGGFAGSFFAARQGMVSPDSFTFIESAIILAIVVLGGRGSQMGVVIAAIIVTGFSEVMRDFAEYRMLLFGVMMVAITVWRPGGLIAFREPTLRLSAAGDSGAANAGPPPR